MPDDSTWSFMKTAPHCSEFELEFELVNFSPDFELEVTDMTAGIPRREYQFDIRLSLGRGVVCHIYSTSPDHDI
jgi:hypothetical protein